MAFEENEDSIQVVSPDGYLGTIPKSGLDQALSDGFSLPTKDDLEVAKYLEENSGVLGSAKTFLGQAADEAFLGIPEKIADSTQDDLEVRKRKALKEAHPTANTLGGITGFGAGLVNPLTGGALTKAGKAVGTGVSNLVGKAVVKEAGESLASKAVAKIGTGVAAGAGLFAEGATFAAPNLVTDAALGNPIDVSEALLAGGLNLGMGAGISTIGGVAGLGRTVAGNIVSHVTGGKTVTELLESSANAMAGRAAGISKASLNSMEKKFGDQFITKVDEAGAILREKGIIGEGLPKSATQIIKKFDIEVAKLGDDISLFYKSLDERIPKESPVINRLEIAEEFQNIIKRNVDDIDPRAANINKYFGGVTDKQLLNSVEEGMTIGELWKLKRDVDSKINWKTIDPEAISANGAYQEMSFIFKNYIDDAIGKAETLVDDPTLLTSIKKMNHDYHTLKNAEPWINNRFKTDAGNNIFSLTDNMAAMGGIVGGTIATGGLGGLAAGATAGGVNYLRRHYGAESLTKVLGGLSKVTSKHQEAISSIPKALSSFGAGTAKTLTNVNAKSMSLNAIARFIGDGKEVPTDKKDQVKYLGEKLAEITSNEQKKIETIANITAPIAEAAPNVAEVYGMQLNKALDYIEKNIPKPKEIDNAFSTG